MIFLAVHQSFTNNKKENIIHPEKIQREMLSDTAGLTVLAHLLNANKKIAAISSDRVEKDHTSLRIENVNGNGFNEFDVDPQVTAP